MNTRRTLATLSLILLSTLAPLSEASAQLVVTDPGSLTQQIVNTVQNEANKLTNIETAAITLDSYIRQGKQLAKQADQLELEIRDLAKLDMSSLRNWFAAMNQIEEIVDLGLELAGSSVEILRDYATTYGLESPPAYKGEDYTKVRKQWSKNVEHSYEKNLKLRARLQALKSKLFDQVDELERLANNVDGGLAAAQLQTKMDTLDVAYRAIEFEMKFSRLEREELEGLEQRRVRQAKRAHALEALGRGMGTHEVSAPPVLLKGFGQ